MNHFVLIFLLTVFSETFAVVPLNEDEILGKIRKVSDSEWIVDKADFLPDEQYIAIAYYTPSLLTVGWDYLSISTTASYPDILQAEAAGRIEAYFTQERIYKHYLNVLGVNGDQTGSTNEFIDAQTKFIIDKYTENPDDPIFYNAYWLQIQLKALRDQYNSLVSEDKKIDDYHFNIISADGDLDDIYSKYNRPNFDTMTTKEYQTYFEEHSHCSAMFKVTADISDIFYGHNTWSSYPMMTRLFKEYNLNYSHPSVKAKNILMSSHPGNLASGDDYYITKNLAVMETTNPVYNSDLYDKIIPQSLLCWQRTLISLRISRTAKEFAENYQKYNSGTYNNMYMALDMTKIDFEKKFIDAQALYSIEQIPGFISIHDVTDHLKFGYWPSYNVPFDTEVSKQSKIAERIAEHPELAKSIDYNICSRAMIMRRDQSKINDIEAFKSFMRYNDFKNDALSYGDPTLTISSRGDLMPHNSCTGAYDAKVSSIKDIQGKVKKVWIISGPTAEGQEPFSFSKAGPCEGKSVEGLPDSWNFSWVQVTNKFEM